MEKFRNYSTNTQMRYTERGDRDEAFWVRSFDQDHVYMSVLLCVDLKNNVFSISLPSPLYQGNTLSLTYVVNYPHCFPTAYKTL